MYIQKTLSHFGFKFSNLKDLKTGPKKQTRAYAEMSGSVSGAKGGSQLVLRPFKRYQGSMPKAINPTVFTPLPTLGAYIMKPSSRLKIGLHKGFCFPRNPPSLALLYVPSLLPATK